MGQSVTRRDSHFVCALLSERPTLFEFAIAAEMFGLARPEFGRDWYQFTTASETARELTTNSGVTIQAQSDLSALRRAGTIVIPGWPMEGETLSREVREGLLTAYQEGARLVSICSGAFLLAELGVLDGRRATTHWLYADAFAERFPRVQLDPHVLFIDEDPIFSSAGSAAGIDLILHLIRKDFGADKANRVARRMVVPPHRDGDQRQFIDAPLAAKDNDRLRPLLEQVRKHPEQDWTIDALSSVAAMSRRTFIRKFRAATGQSPTEYVRQVRLKRAQDLLEQSERGLEAIAFEAGFGSLASMNHHFRRQVGCSPNTFRQRFRHKTLAQR